jgi:hypothetical protein
MYSKEQLLPTELLKEIPYKITIEALEFNNEERLR